MLPKSDGEFGNFLESLEILTRKDISNSIGIKVLVDPDGRMPSLMVYTLKALRNAVAHNNTVFDTRFKTGSVNGRIANYISAETGITNINFSSIVDYVILISFIMKMLECPKSDISFFIRQFEQACEDFRHDVPISVFNSVIYTDTRSKLNLLKKYL